MNAARSLIVNADDFGLSAGVNRGIIEAHERGIVTSVSLMVRGPAAAAAASYARAHPALSVGLHLDLGEWAWRDGGWVLLYEVVPADDAAAVADEAARQLAAFGRLVGRNPTHLDSHQHVHRDEPVHSVLRRAAGELRIPLRHFSAVVRYCGSFYGQTARGEPYPEGIGVGMLARLVAAPAPGVTELGCHPGYADDVDTTYRAERAREVEALCDPAVRTALAVAGVRLLSFHEVSGPPG
jgi:chitin disaccharide deacetylase